MSRPGPNALQQVRPRAIEWPTLLIAGLIYAGWLGATFFHAVIPLPLRVMLGGWIVAWHGSLQHETIHGHPTRWPTLNRLIGAAPLCLWLPYEHYRRSHLAHHAAERLTDPACDPEARYRAAPTGTLSRLDLAAQSATSSLAGRLLLGPWVEVGGFLGRQLIEAGRTPRKTAAIWLPHLASVALVTSWLRLVCHLGLLEYLLVFVYPATALSLLRAFAEHRADPDPGRRIATVERAPLLGLLFLNNNLHLIHHRAPGAPWYRLPGLYGRARADVLRSGGPVYRGYREVAARYLFQAHDRIVHPAPTWGQGT